MRYRSVVPFLTAVLLAGCGEPPAEEGASMPEASAVTDQEAIAALADSWETRYNAQEPERVAALYVADAWTAPAEGGWLEGREQIRGWVAENTAGASTAEIEPMETVILGDRALGMGRYSVTTTGPDGNPMEISGAYMNALSKVDGEWRIVGSMSNYDSPRPAGWEWGTMPEEETPPDFENQFSGLVESFQEAWNAGDAAAIGELYVDGALAAFSNAPIANGPSGVEATLAERMEPGMSLEIHQVEADQIDETHWGSGGWYATEDSDGNTVQSGMWWNIYEIQDDGSPKIVWTMTNAFPMAM
ncbi:MAG: SgcJ/EcaC family oxidoreductase [Gemmatimonadota bacterium]